MLARMRTSRQKGSFTVMTDADVQRIADAVYNRLMGNTSPVSKCVPATLYGSAALAMFTAREKEIRLKKRGGKQICQLNGKTAEN